MAHYTPVSQERISPEIWQRSETMDAMAFRSEETLQSLGPELYSYLKPHSSHYQGWPGQRGDTANNSIDRRPDGSGIQPEEEAQRGILGGPVSCDGGGNGFSSESMHGVC